MAFFQAIQLLQAQDISSKGHSLFVELFAFMSGFHKCALDSGITSGEYDYIIGGLVKFVPEVMFFHGHIHMS